jgi:predicted kinase
VLIVFGGLPGTGKTTLARLAAKEYRAVYLRIDTIEQALRSSGALAGEVGGAGYIVGYALAEANLRLGQIVAADSVNPLALTRDAWRKAAGNAQSRIVEIEMVCSDPAEHRRRIETRSVDVAGLVLPTWEAVQRREYEKWDRPRLVLDTAGRTIDDAFSELRLRLDL